MLRYISGAYPNIFVFDMYQIRIRYTLGKFNYPCFIARNLKHYEPKKLTTSTLPKHLQQVTTSTATTSNP